MDRNNGLIALAGLLIAGGVGYLIYRDNLLAAEPETPEPPVCNEGDLKCVGFNLMECQGNKWVIIEADSPYCGYEPTTPPPPPDEINIHGYIRDSISMQPVLGAYVTINGIHANDGGNGLYYLYHMDPSPSVIITIEAEGYNPYEEEFESNNIMNVDIVMVAIETPEPPPPMMDFNFTKLRFTFIKDGEMRHSYCAPIGQSSNVSVDLDREISGPLDTVTKVKCLRYGNTTTTKKHFDWITKASRLGLGYIGFASGSGGTYTEGDYIFYISAYSGGELVAYNELTVRGTTHPEECEFTY